MAKPTTPAKLADPTPADIAGRIALDARALAQRSDSADAGTLSTVENYDALRILSSSLDRLRRDVESYRTARRPTVYPRSGVKPTTI